MNDTKIVRSFLHSPICESQCVNNLMAWVQMLRKHLSHWLCHYLLFLFLAYYKNIVNFSIILVDFYYFKIFFSFKLYNDVCNSFVFVFTNECFLKLHLTCQGPKGYRILQDLMTVMKLVVECFLRDKLNNMFV